MKTYDMQARSYRPDIARFTSTDRYQSAAADLTLQADPLTQNRYAFAAGNPVNNIEYDGHKGWDDLSPGWDPVDVDSAPAPSSKKRKSRSSGGLTGPGGAGVTVEVATPPAAHTRTAGTTPPANLKPWGDNQSTDCGKVQFACDAAGWLHRRAGSPRVDVKCWAQNFYADMHAGAPHCNRPDFELKHPGELAKTADVMSNLSLAKAAGGLGFKFGLAMVLHKTEKEIAEKAGGKVAQHDIVRYSARAPGFEKHHGVLNVWAKHNVPGYRRRAAPTIVLTEEQHTITKTIYRDWLKSRTGTPIGGVVDWHGVSARDIQDLTYRMLDRAGVPDQVQRDYVRAFHQYIYGP